MDSKQKLKSELKRKKDEKSIKIKRLPVGKVQPSFQFPPKFNTLKGSKVVNRKIQIINVKDLRRFPTNTMKPFLGTLHLF